MTIKAFGEFNPKLSGLAMGLGLNETASNGSIRICGCCILAVAQFFRISANFVRQVHRKCSHPQYLHHTAECRELADLQQWEYR